MTTPSAASSNEVQAFYDKFGQRFSCLSSNDVVLFGWGVTEDGQLGLESPDNVASPKVIEFFLGSTFAGVEYGRAPVVCGSRVTLVLDGQGQLYSFGWNDRATLGVGHSEPTEKPHPVRSLRGVQIIQADVGGWHAAAVSAAGDVYAWGGNEYGQCSRAEGQRDIPRPMRTFGGHKVRQVACGGMHTNALTTDGNVWQWGERWGDFSGHLDRGPRQVVATRNVVAICTDAFHTLALTCDGRIFAWGTNDYGQLGNGTTLHQTDPGEV